ncbi:LPS-assembly protein LptD [Panacibacter ginsenosidivorans]|uniref:LPS-assembly protein LptD n=1 Tax=Panacibacter ginsenosidivorans TaxID=1813871 RepID=A0A5B8VCG7_9BACT|nr:putative LPS assembly protein LptD [Panacibacter ginsenosidivorans]QEC68992.1 LPS-assembly protein LptD [Panacibacter ginsenosidivorans]
MLLTAITFITDAKYKSPEPFFKLLTACTDTTIKNDTVIKTAKDTSIHNTGDSATLKDTSGTIITVDTLNYSKDSIDAPIDYSAEDSGVLIIKDKKFMLYGKAKAKHADIALDANTIIYDQATQVITAYGGTDTSLGALNKPKLVQGETESTSDTIAFNMKNQRGLTKNTYLKEGEMFVAAQRFKKISKDEGFGYRTTFTTCNLDTPHFDFRAKKIKIINNKIAVSGPAYPEFEGVPMPIAIPFGIFPLNRGRHSGLLPPQFASSQDFGLGLEGLGYYKVLSDNYDVTIRGNIYSYGGWSVNITPDYYKRYKYKGNLNLAIQKTKILNSSPSSKEEFTTSNSFFITWTHSRDPKARPGTSFSASVRAGSTKYNQYVTNNSYTNFQNQLSSSITWSKNWSQGKYNLSVSANHDQNNNLGLVNLRIPTVNFSATTLYPLQPKDFVGIPKWYQKLGVSYTGTVLNQMSFYDSAFSFNKLLDTAQWGVEHRIPISLTLPPLGPFTVSPSISYSERWYGQILNKRWDDKTDSLITTIQRGFYTAREVSFGISANTRIFGTFNFPKSKGIKAIRHEVKPFISMSYKPDLVSQYYKTVQIDSSGENFSTYSVLQGGVLGTYSQGKFGGLSFGIDNLLEMKVKDKKDTSASATKKIRLIDGLGVTGGYNLIADSLNWSPFSFSLRSTLFDKINITGSASMDPYGVDTFGRRVNRLLWKEGKIGRLTNGSLAISTSLKSKSKDGKTDKERIPVDETLTPDEQLQQLEYVRNNPSEFVDFDIPWNVSLSFSLSFYRTLSPNLKDYVTSISSNLSVNGDFSLTPKWKIGGNTYFDFKTAKIQQLSMFITREMHCWQLAINVTPVGLYRSFNITLNPKSGILRDLRINRSRFFYSQ